MTAMKVHAINRNYFHVIASLLSAFQLGALPAPRHTREREAQGHHAWNRGQRRRRTSKSGKAIKKGDQGYMQRSYVS